MTQRDLDTKQINGFIDDSFSEMKSWIPNVQIEQKETPQILLFLIRKNIEGTEMYGSYCSFVKGTVSELRKEEEDMMKTIVEIEKANILCGCSITYWENELRMRFTDYVNKDFKYRVHNFDSVSSVIMLN